MPDDHLTTDEIFALRNEVKLSEKFIEHEVEPKMNEAISRYTGTHLPMVASDWSIILNEIYPVIQYNLPAIFFRNPQVYLLPRNKFYIAKKRNPMTGELESVQLDSLESAKTQEAILNYTLEQIRYKQEVRKVLLDSLLFQHGVLWHGYKGDFGMTQERSLYIDRESLYVLRVSPAHFLWDSSVSIENVDQARWIGRAFFMRYTDLMDDADLDVDKNRLKGVLGYGERIKRLDVPAAGGKDTIQLGASRLRELIEYAEDGFKLSPRARFVKLYEIFHRPTPKEEKKGEKGKIALLCFEQEKPLRVNPWPYKAKGFPAKVLQFNPVPDRRLGLTDMEVYGSIADHKNLVINQQIRNAEQTNRSIMAVAKEGMDEEDVEKARRGDNAVFLYDGENVAGKLAVINAGATSSSELYMLDQRIDKNLQDKSGVSDLKRGFSQSGEESATSIRARQAGGGARPAYRQDLMADFLSESCLYLNELNKQYMTVEEAVRIVGSLDIEWSNTPTKEEIQAEVDVQLDVQSMTPENPDLEIQQLTTILNLMVEALSNPAILQKVEQEGKIFNLAPIIEQLLYRLKIRNPEVFRTIKPEETQGYVEVSELRAAQANVGAVLQRQPPPSPPQPGQNHAARLEIYGAISQLLQEMGHISDGLQQLIQIQGALLAAEQEKEGQVGQVLPKGSRNGNAQRIGKRALMGMGV